MAILTEDLKRLNPSRVLRKRVTLELDNSGQWTAEFWSAPGENIVTARDSAILTRVLKVGQIHNQRRTFLKQQAQKATLSPPSTSQKVVANGTAK